MAHSRWANNPSKEDHKVKGSVGSKSILNSVSPFHLSIWWNMVIIWLRNPLISIFPRNWSYPYFPRLDCTESLRATSDMHRLDALAQGGGLSRSIILAEQWVIGPGRWSNCHLRSSSAHQVEPYQGLWYVVPWHWGPWIREIHGVYGTYGIHGI